MRTFFLLTLLLAALTSCSTTKFRSSLCDGSEIELPAELTGLYRLSLPSPNIEYSGTNTFDEIYLRIGSTGLVEIFMQELLSAKLQSKLASPGFALGPICRTTGNRMIAEIRNGDGTYSVSLVDFSKGAVTYSEPLFNPEELHAAGIPFLVVPRTPSELILPGETIVLEGSEVIIDNRGLDTRRIFELARPMSSGLIMSKVEMRPDSFKLRARFRI